MRHTEDWENFILRCVERWWGGRFSERHAMVTSYDPDNHLAKVKFMPEGQESGWLPIETTHIGNGYGMVVGLEAGDGRKTGDQVVCRLQGNDFNSCKISRVVPSKVDKPPKVESGEMCIWTKWGQQIRFNKDGSLTCKTGVQTQPDQPGPGMPQLATAAGGQPQNAGAQPIAGKSQSNMKSNKTVTVTLDAYGNHTVSADTNITNTAGANLSNSAQQTYSQTAGQNIDQQAGADITHVAGNDIVHAPGNINWLSQDGKTDKGGPQVLTTAGPLRKGKGKPA